MYKLTQTKRARGPAVVGVTAFVVAGLLVATQLVAVPIAAASTRSPSARRSVSLTDESKKAVLHNYSQLPIRFEKNQGQTDQQVRFVSRGPGYTLFLTQTEAVVALMNSPGRKTGSSKTLENLPYKGAEPAKTGVVRLSLENADPAATMTGLGRLAGKSNYLVGSDSSNWKKGVPGYAQVASRRVYPGIDLLWHGGRGTLEYDFKVAPGADPSRISLSVRGADKLTLSKSGDLVAATPAGNLVQRKPYIYQVLDGRRQQVTGGYELDGTRVRFRIGKYDRARPLVIDPVVSYSSYLGGAGAEIAQSASVDQSGNVYVAGITDSADFPTKNPFRERVTTTKEVFVTKVNPAASGSSSLVYSTYLTGGECVDCNEIYGEAFVDIAVDPVTGSAYVTGQTSSATFPTTPNAYQSTHANPANAYQAVGNRPGDAFFSQLNAAGSELIYSTFLGAEGSDSARAIAVDVSGKAYITGSTHSQSFPVKSPYQGVEGPASSLVTRSTDSIDNGSEVFVAKFDPLAASGKDSLRYSTYLGGDGKDTGHGIAVDEAGKIYVTGQTASPNFPAKNAFRATPGEAPLGLTNANRAPARYTVETVFGTSRGDAFLAKLDPASSGPASLVYATYLGGGDARGNGVAVDASGSAHVTGRWDNGPDGFPATPGAFQPIGSTGGAVDAFLMKFNSAGNVLEYSSLLGGSTVGSQSGYDEAKDVAIDQRGNVYLAGMTYSPNFPVKDAFQDTYSLPGVGPDAFVAKFDPALLKDSSLIYSSFLGGTQGDSANGVAVDSGGNAYVTGTTASANLGATEGAFQPSNGGATDAFVVKVGNEPLVPPAVDSADLEISVGVPSTVTVGSELTYAVRVLNRGPDTAKDVWLYDALPKNVVYKSSSATQGSCSGTSENVSCGLGDLPSGSAATATIVIAPVLPGSLTNTASTSSHVRDPNTSNNTATTVVVPSTAPPNVTISDTQVVEGHPPSTTDATVKVTLNRGGLQGDVRVNYTTANGTAMLSDSDYVSKTGFVTFTGTETEKPITVQARGDEKIEPDEVFQVLLNGVTPQGVTLIDNRGLVTIKTDDAAASVFTVSDPKVEEGLSGNTPAEFTVTRTDSRQIASVTYSTANGTAMLSNRDYQAVTNVPLEFAPGELSKTFTINVVGDATLESDEFFTVFLKDSTGTMMPERGIGTIENDDLPPLPQQAGPVASILEAVFGLLRVFA